MDCGGFKNDHDLKSSDHTDLAHSVVYYNKHIYANIHRHIYRGHGHMQVREMGQNWSTAVGGKLGFFKVELRWEATLLEAIKLMNVSYVDQINLFQMFSLIY